MTVAVNPETGAAVYLDNDTGVWVPAQVATHPETKESVAFDGQAWVPVKMPQKPGAPTIDWKNLSLEKFGTALKETWNEPARGPSILGMAKTAVDAFTNPLPAFVPTFQENSPESEAALKRGRDIATSTMIMSAGAAARRGVDPNVLGMNFVPKTPQFTPATQQVVERAGNINVPIPRYMVDENIGTQGLAAGLKNIPFVGTPIREAATNTVQALGRAASAVQEGYGTGSPAVAGSAAKDALVTWVTGGTEKDAAGNLIPQGSKAVADRVYGAVDNLVNPAVTTELKATGAVAQNIMNRRANAAITGESPAVNIIMEAVTKPGGLNYDGIKTLRSFLGEKTPQELAAQGLSGTEVKQLYGALSVDLRNAVRNAGGNTALAAFEKANRIYNMIGQRRDALSKILGVSGDASPEAVYARILAMAGSKSTANISTLALARKTMGSDAWNEVASAVVSKLGRDAEGNFSIDRFLTAYGNLSPAGRQQLFSTTGKDNLARSLEDINLVSSSLNQKIKQFYNPSGTAQSLTATGAVLGIIHHPLFALATLVGGTKMANVLSEPVTAQATATWLRAYRDAITAPSAGASLRVRNAAEKLAGMITGGKGDPALTGALFPAAIQQPFTAPQTNPP